MSVHQLKDGRWIVHYRIRDGKKLKPRREYFGRGSGAETKARERDADLAFMRHSKSPAPDNISPLFSELAAQYLTGRIASIEPTTYSVLKYKLKALLLPEFGNTESLKITKERIDQYVIKRQALGLKNATISREITDIQAIMNWAVGRALISQNPLSGYKKPRPDPEIITPPTLTEMKAIDKFAPPHLQRALKIIFYTGSRPGREILSLKWSSVNFDQNSMRIISAKKHGLKYRDVPLYKEFRDLLEAWKEEDVKRVKVLGARVQEKQKDEELEKKINNMSIVNYKGASIKSLQTSWGRVKRLSGITRAIRPYSYRHAFVSMMLDAGADLKSVSEIVGHSNPTLTLRVYQHTNKLMHQNAINKLPMMGW
jgi:integrase